MNYRPSEVRFSRSRRAGGRVLNEIEARTDAAGLSVATWAPGDGVKRYRFFRRGADGSVHADYHQGHELFTARGRKEALAFLAGHHHTDNRARGTIRRNRAAGRTRTPRATAPVDRIAADELLLFTQNTGELYAQRQAIETNLRKKMAKRTYQHAKAVTLWMYWMESGAKRYAKEMGDGRAWHAMFPAPTRRAAAEEAATQFENGTL
jgi:hypothetical protein